MNLRPYRKVILSSSLNPEEILNLIKQHTYSIDEWQVQNRRSNVYTNERSFTCEIIDKNTFKLRARKINQLRQSRPISYGKILQANGKSQIKISTVPHIVSILILALCLFVVFLGAASGSIQSFFITTIIYALIYSFIILNFHLESKLTESFVQNILKKFKSKL